MTEQKVSFRYARALLDVAVKENLSDILVTDLNLVRGILEGSRELRLLIKSPILQESKKVSVLKSLFMDKVNEITLRFLIFLINKGRGEIMIDIIAQYLIQYDQLNNRLPVAITSAVDLNDELKSRITNRIESFTNKTVLPDFLIDERIKGGLLVRIDDVVYDATLKNQLENLFKMLTIN